MRHDGVCIFPQDPTPHVKTQKVRRKVWVKPPPPRGFWRNRAAYMQSMTTFCLGLTNIWRFPWLMYQYASGGGAGAFLFVYILMMLIIGMPLLYFETALGQVSLMSPVMMWDMAPIGRGIGWSMFIVCIYITIIYAMLAPWAILYMLYTFWSPIAWDDCVDRYPSDNHSCIPRLCWEKDYPNQMIPSETLFYTHVVWFKFNGIEDGLGEVHWASFGFLFLAWTLVYLMILRSVRSIGQVIFCAAVLPLIVFIILFITSMLLEGVVGGIVAFFTPVGTDFLDPQLWRQAAEHALFSLGLSYGLVIAMGSYINFRNPTQKDTCEFWSITFSFALLYALALFAFVGVLATELGAHFDIVAYEGPGTNWVIFPETMERLKLNHFWSILLFLMIFLMAVAVTAMLVETIMTVLYDESPYLRNYRFAINFVVCLGGLMLCLAFTTRGGLYIVHVMDVMPASMPLLPIAACELLVVVYVYDVGRFNEDIYYMMKVSTNPFYTNMWRALPFILLLIILVTWPFHEKPELLGWTCPTDAYIVAWVLTLLALLPIPGYAIWWIYHCNKGGHMDRVFAPATNWHKRFKQSKE